MFETAHRTAIYIRLGSLPDSRPRYIRNTFDVVTLRRADNAAWSTFVSPRSIGRDIGGVIGNDAVSFSDLQERDDNIGAVTDVSFVDFEFGGGGGDSVYELHCFGNC